LKNNSARTEHVIIFLENSIKHSLDMLLSHENTLIKQFIRTEWFLSSELCYQAPQQLELDDHLSAGARKLGLSK